MPCKQYGSQRTQDLCRTPLLKVPCLLASYCRYRKAKKYKVKSLDSNDMNII